MTPILKKPLLALALTAIALLPACAQPEAGTASKAELEKIIHDYIVEHPEVVEEALIALGDREKAAKAAAAQAAIKANAQKLYAHASDYSIGPADAKVTIVEFFDYRCGFCKRSADWVRELPEAYDGQVRVVYKELPIFGGISENAALATLAAGKQGKYVDLHMALMALKSNDDLTEKKIDELAGAVGINVAKMRADMKSSAVQKQLADMKELGKLLDVGGTPGFFIGDQHIEGANVPAVEAAIDAALKS
ncbi:MAG: DsbA family protein [Hyphomonas sp.]|uniref:DsbA family protein n=1 Tax=Hyphomonas sp. TaxID=87 RepID=UPI0017D309CD|nr:DsbA family protein [Hyphomonas sp.]MBA3067934.1 DsbA family protein [Hyphomonas sp.]MBU4061272.1 DsbA family protein [Alphaproteobacteria bacterium]MBU4162525.1 DsbA family protein [Alphaproteobacteria bacterium]